MHDQCSPFVKADAESIGWEIINYIDQLDPRCLHMLQRDFATYWRLSNR
jgi:hypothetical protein